jgi:hypothetical protein
MLWILKYIQEDENLFINQNFFGWKNKVSQNDIDELLKTFDEKLSEIKNIKKELKDSDLQDVEKKFILNSLNWAGLKYMIFKSAAFLEAEKSGFELTPDQRNFYLRRVNKLQSMVYWPEISSIDSEKTSVLNELNDIYVNNISKLEEWEKNIYLEYLKTLWFSWINNNITKDKEVNNKLENIYLSKEKIIELFEMIIDLYNLDWWSISLENVWNFSVNLNDKEVILPEFKLEQTSLKRLFQLFDHEIWVHGIRWDNSLKTLNTNWDWYLEVEEWFATFWELLFDQKTQNISIKPTLHHITTYVAENLNFDDTVIFLELYYKLLKPKGTSSEDIKKEALDRALRVKRFVSLKEKWANRKDVSYTNWQAQIVEYFQNSDDLQRQQFLKDFYFAKLSFEDIW